MSTVTTVGTGAERSGRVEATAAFDVAVVIDSTCPT